MHSLIHHLSKTIRRRCFAYGALLIGTTMKMMSEDFRMYKALMNSEFSLVILDDLMETPSMYM